MDNSTNGQDYKSVTWESVPYDTLGLIRAVRDHHAGKLTAAENAVLKNLLTYMNPKGHCYPSAETVGAGTGLTSRTVGKAYKGLRAKGYMTTKRRQSGTPLHTIQIGRIFLSETPRQENNDNQIGKSGSSDRKKTSFRSEEFSYKESIKDIKEDSRGRNGHAQPDDDKIKFIKCLDRVDAHDCGETDTQRGKRGIMASAERPTSGSCCHGA